MYYIAYKLALQQKGDPGKGKGFTGKLEGEPWEARMQLPMCLLNRRFKNGIYRRFIQS